MDVVPTPLRRLLHALGVNRAVAYALAGQAAAMAIQPIVVLLIARYLTEVEQGYYFVFNAIIGLQIFFDLGFGQATLQFASVESGHLTWTPERLLVGEPAAKSRLASVLRLSLAWYCVVAAVLIAGLLPGGWLYFADRDTGGVAWKLAWAWTVVATAGLFVTIPLVQFLAACGKMAEAMWAMAVQRACTGAALCLALAGGARLFSSAVGQTVGLAVFGYWLVRYWSPVFRDLYRQPLDGPRVSWWRELWPFQWKVALTGLAFYLTAQTFSLFLFDDTAAGKAEAGRMGASLLIMGLLVNSAATWFNARVPLFGQLVGRQEWAELDHVFRRVLVQSVLVSAVGAVIVWAVFAVLHAADYPLGYRVLPPLPLALLLANAVVQTTVLALNAYLRAHKREPFLWVFVALGVSMLVAVLTVGRAYGAVGMAASLLVLDILICLGVGGRIFVRCRRAWHAPVPHPVPAAP
jgi:hypothetical protein